MGNEIEKRRPNELITPTSGTVQQAETIIVSNEIGSVTTKNITYMFVPTGEGDAKAIPTNYCSSKEYYNLFVQCEEEWPSSGQFVVKKDCALNSFFTAECIREEINDLCAEAIERIKEFPALFCTKNCMYGIPSEKQTARYGIVTEVKVQDDGIKIRYIILNSFPQKVLTENLINFGLEGNDLYNELDEIHWAVKNISLVKNLKELGVPLFTWS